MTPLSLSTLSTTRGSRHRSRRVGRGNGSRGSYSGRGAKGQRSRTGGTRGIIRRSMRSLMERVPKQRGFRSMTEKAAVVNLSDLAKHFKANTVVTMQMLVDKGLIKLNQATVKVLGNGKLSHALTVHAHAFSASSKAALEAAGGKAVTIGAPAKVEGKPSKST